MVNYVVELNCPGVGFFIRLDINRYEITAYWQISCQGGGKNAKIPQASVLVVGGFEGFLVALNVFCRLSLDSVLVAWAIFKKSRNQIQNSDSITGCKQHTRIIANSIKLN